MKSREERFAEYDAWRQRHHHLLEKLSEVLQHPDFPGYRKQGDITEENLAKGYAAGVIAKSQLKHGVYYFGKCRNAYVARWDAERQRFTYIREKFGDRFPEDINAPEDDNGYDLFVAVAEVEPEEQEKIPQDWSGW